MGILRIAFAAPVQKVEIKQVGGKPLAEVSICRKNRTKENEQDAFTWLRIAVWAPPDWMVSKLKKGALIAGSGDFTLRSYDKDGQKRQSAECNCQSFDVEVSGDSEAKSEAPPAPAVAPVPATPVRSRPAPAPVAVSSAPEDFEPPF